MLPLDDPEFAPPEAAARREVLAEAARLVDLRRAHLGVDATAPESPEGALLRSLSADIVEFAGFPVVHAITDRDFLSRSRPAPVRYTELARRFRFSWLHVPIALFPQRNWAFNRLEVVVQFSPDEARPELRPKAYQILPDRKFQRLLELSMALNVRLDENFEFSAQVPQLPLGDAAPASLRASVATGLEGGLGAVVGPFTYRFKRAQIDHTPVGFEKVRWRIDGAEFFQEDAPELIVILQVPRDARVVQVRAALQASRYFNYASAGLQEAIRGLGDSLRQFFQRGAPLGDSASWDLSGLV